MSFEHDPSAQVQAESQLQPHRDSPEPAGVGAPFRGPAADASAAGRGVAYGDVTILKFRHLLEKHGLGEGLFAEINAHLVSLGQRVPKRTFMASTAHAVLHGGEGTVWGDAGYQRVGKRDGNKNTAVDGGRR